MQPSRARMLLWLGFAVAVGGGLWAGWFALLDRDLGLHLALGRYMVGETLFPPTDPFSYMASDVAWANHEWLFDHLVYGLYTALGPPGLVAVKLLVVAGLAALVVQAARQLEPDHPAWAALVAGALLLVAWPVVRPRLTMRPHLFGLLLFLGHLVLARRLADASEPGRRNRLAAALGGTTPLWTNLHGSWPLAFLVTGAHVVTAAGRRRRFVVLGAVQLLLLPLNPWGLELLATPFEHLTPEIVRRYFMEFQPPSWNLLPSQITISLGLLALAILSTAILRRRRDLAEVLVAAAVVALGFRSWRFVAWGLLLLLPPLSARLGSSLPALPRRAPALAAVALLLCGGLTQAMKLDDQLQPYPRGWHWQTDYLPRQAARFIEAKELPGPIFNDLNVGDDLIWTLGPERKIAIDGRIGLYVGHFFRDYVEIVQNPERYREHVRKHDVQLVLLDFTVGRHRALVEHLGDGDEHGLVFFDDTYAVWARDEALERARREGLVLEHLRPSRRPGAMVAEAAEAAREEIARVERWAEPPFGALLRVVWRWQAWRDTGERSHLEALIRHAGDVLAERPELLHARLRRGQAHYELGRLEEAVADLEIAVRYDDRAVVRGMLREARRRLGEGAEADEEEPR